MAVSLKHAFQSAKADGVDTTVVQPSNWNAEHQLTCATGVLLGRTTAGTGAVEELTASAARTFLSALNKTGDTMTGDLSIINGATEMKLTLGSSGGYYFGNATTAGYKNSGGTTMVSWNFTSGDFTAAGNITAYSDERVKKDISTVEGALALVQKMRGVRYTRRSDDVRGVGVIAQEIKKVLPEVVTDNESGRLSVAYGNIVGVLIEAIKELADRVEELEAR